MKYSLCLALMSSFLMLSWNTPENVNVKTPDDYYWQQHVDYTMEIDMDVDTYRYHGKQTLVYTNNSPDTLHRVFYHLYFKFHQIKLHTVYFSRIAKWISVHEQF